MEKFTAEVWRTIEIDGMLRNVYQVSNFGRIKNNKGILKGSLIQGYPTLNVRPSGKSLVLYVHKLVAKYFIEQPTPNHKFVIHLGLDKTNNHHTNLKWVTKQELIEHVSYHQKGKVGSSYRNNKLRTSQVKIIKRLLDEGEMKISHIARKYKISHTQLNRIRSGENWGSV